MIPINITLVIKCRPKLQNKVDLCSKMHNTYELGGPVSIIYGEKREERVAAVSQSDSAWSGGLGFFYSETSASVILH